MGMPLGLQVFSRKVELDKLEFWPENESSDYSPSIKWWQLLLWGGWMCVEHFMAILPTVAETFHSELQLSNGGTKRKSHQITKVNNIIFAIWEPWKFIPNFFCQSIVPCDEKSDLLVKDRGQRFILWWSWKYNFLAIHVTFVEIFQ